MPTLNWIGKEAVVKHHKEVSYCLLEPVSELSCGDVNSGNLIVQGNNLLALKALWAELSCGKCHFVMVKNKEWEVIDDEIKKALA